MSEYLVNLGIKAKEASRKMALLGVTDKNRGLKAVSAALKENMEPIMAANAIDVKMAEEKGVKASLIDRLKVNEARILAMAEGIDQVISLNDPVGEIKNTILRPNGLLIGKKVVPLGVIGIIYESRPNVTADAFALCCICNLSGRKTVRFSCGHGGLSDPWMAGFP